MKLFLNFIAVIMLLSACDSTVNDLTVIKRIPSPDGKVEVVIAFDNIDTATVSKVTSVYIVPIGEVPRKQNLVLRGDGLLYPHAYWKQPAQLELTYHAGRIFQFVNFWQNKQVDNFKYLVEINLKKIEPY